MIETIDNILQQEQLQSFKEVVESKWFPWNFLDNSAYPDDKELIKRSALNYSFYHMCWDNSELMSNYFNKFALIKLASVMKNKFKLDEDDYDLFRMRLGMTTSIDKVHQNTPHVDWDTPHKVILFYFNNADGDTYFYDKDEKIIETVSPKENRAVLFDGSILHASSKPVEFSRRIVLNINLLEKN